MVISPEIGTYHSDVHVSLSETYLKKEDTTTSSETRGVQKRKKKGLRPRQA